MTRPILIANEHGDWWQHIPNAFPAPKLYVLNLNVMNKSHIKELAEALQLKEDELDDNIMLLPNVHEIIWEHGNEFEEPIDNEEIFQLSEHIKSLQALVERLRNE